jgi:hypothetical protein
VISLAWLSVATLGIAVASSRAPEVSFNAVVVIAVAIVVFVFVAFGGVEVNDIVGAFVLVVSVMAIFVLYQSIRHGVNWFETMDLLVPEASWTEKLPVSLPRESFSALSHNYTAMIGAMAIPLAIFMWVDRSVPRWLVGLSLLLILGMILATGSRGGWIASGVAALIAILGVAWLRAPDQWRRAAKWSSLTVGALAVVLVGLYLAGFRPGFLFRGTLGDRLPVMRAGWEMFLDRPWLGHGPGSFPWLVDGYLGPTYPGTEARIVWNNAHNGYVGLLAEFGMVGTVLLVGSVFAVVVLSLRGIRNGPPDSAPLQVACVAALVGVGLHSLIEVPTLGLAPVGFIAVTLGLLVAGQNRDWGSSWPRFAAGGLAALVGVGMYLGSGSDHTTGVSAMWRGDWSTAVSEFHDFSEQETSILVSRLGTVAELEAGIVVDSDEVRVEALSAPFSMSAWLNVIEVERRQGRDYGRTVRSIIDSVPYDEVSMLQSGSLLDSLGERESADDLYLNALLMNPWLAGSGFWGGVEGGAERVRGLYQRAAAMAPCRLADEFVLVEVWDSSMTPEVEECSEAAPAALAVALFEGEQDRVGPIVSALVSQAPDDVGARRLAGLEATMSGREQDAARQWGIGALLGDPWATARLGDLYWDEIPTRIEDLLRANYQGYSPVLRGLGSPPVYRLDSARIGSVFRRSGPPSTLVQGPWVEATTVTHDHILELLGIES